MTVQESRLAPPPVTETQQLQSVPVSHGGPAGHGRRTWPLVTLVIMSVVAVALAGAIVWLMASTVPTGDYDDAIADLQAEQSKVTALADENSGLTADVSTLSEERDQLLANVAAAAVTAKAMAYIELNYDPAYVEEMAQAGIDLTPFDELLALLGEDVALTEWVASNDAFRAAEWSVYETEDAQLIDAWNTWLETEMGSLDDAAAWEVLQSRLDQLINEQLVINAAPVAINNDAG